MHTVGHSSHVERGEMARAISLANQYGDLISAGKIVELELKHKKREEKAAADAIRDSNALGPKASAIKAALKLKKVHHVTTLAKLQKTFATIRIPLSLTQMYFFVRLRGIRRRPIGDGARDFYFMDAANTRARLLSCTTLFYLADRMVAACAVVILRELATDTLLEAREAADRVAQQGELSPPAPPRKGGAQGALPEQGRAGRGQAGGGAGCR